MCVDFCMMITTFVEHFDDLDSAKFFYMLGGGGVHVWISA